MTAVEWLKKEIDPINKTQIEWHEIFDQAKEIENQQKDDYAIEFAEWIIKGKLKKEALERFKKEKGL